MIKSLEDQIRELDTRMGRNQKLYESGNFKEETDPRINFRLKRINDLKELVYNTQEKINYLQNLLHNFVQSSDQKKENSLKIEIKKVSTSVEHSIKKVKEKLDQMRQKQNLRIQGRENQINADTDIRMLETVINTYRVKSMDLLKKYSKLQIDIKKSFADKVRKQLLLVVDAEQAEEIMSQGIDHANQQLHALIYGNNESEQLNNALQDIKERVQDIKRIEKGVKKLLSLIQELQMLISSQTEVINSIDYNVSEIKNHIEIAAEKVDDSNKLMMDASEKLWCLFVIMVVFAIFIMNSVLKSVIG